MAKKAARKIETDSDVDHACTGLMEIVSRVAGRRLKLILEAASKMARNSALEEAAKVADEHSSPPFGHDDPVAVNFWHLGEAYARKEIAKGIRAQISK